MQQLFPNTQNGSVQINPIGDGTVKAGQKGQADRGLQISADGNTLTFNGYIIAGTGAANGSVNYSQGNPIVWGVNSTGTEGGFYSNGINLFWKAQALKFDQFFQEQ
ncbi:MAG: hypothetical protein EZS28_019404 [Streblomastix strix]|uniref:Uncharacterized protein n=1 Tax=Streblomastix strix TaxID=222440 RepID=A0A5J4VQV6_9EUKA|nr:MAG: hypothetical protein EZS28_019404 [Streblomastix strix]